MPTRVFFVETIGKMIYSQTFRCAACDHATRVERDVDGPEMPDVGDWELVRHPCERCGQLVRLTSTGGSPYYRRPDTGETFGGQRKLPPGACFDATWLHGHPQYCGPDGRALHVVLPTGHVWHVDGRASNCTRPDDDVHKCWVRHGRPEDGTLHVDKQGNTCAAGAGSIMVPGYHGFLRHGYLTDNC